MYLVYKNVDKELEFKLSSGTKELVWQGNTLEEVKPHFYQLVSDYQRNVFCRIDAFETNENTIDIATYIVPSFLATEVHNVWIEEEKYIKHYIVRLLTEGKYNSHSKIIAKDLTWLQASSKLEELTSQLLKQFSGSKLVESQNVHSIIQTFLPVSKNKSIEVTVSIEAQQYA